MGRACAAQQPTPLLVLFPGSWRRLTFLAEAAPVAGEAKADKRVDLINAGASVLTGAGDAVIDIWRGGTESEVSHPSALGPHKEPGRG